MSSGRRLPLGSVLRFALLLALLGAGILALRSTPVGELLEQERLLAILGELRETWWAPLFLLGLFVAVAPFPLPISPVLFAGGVVFGPLFGTVYNTTGLFLGAVVSFVLARFLGRDFVEHLAGERLRAAEDIFQRHGFWPLVKVRFLPVPFLVANYGAALAGVRPGRFLATTALGLLPATAFHTYFASAIFHATGDPPRLARLLAVYLALWTLLAGLSWLPNLKQAYRAWKQR